MHAESFVLSFVMKVIRSPDNTWFISKTISIAFRSRNAGDHESIRCTMRSTFIRWAHREPFKRSRQSPSSFGFQFVVSLCEPECLRKIFTRVLPVMGSDRTFVSYYFVSSSLSSQPLSMTMNESEALSPSRYRNCFALHAASCLFAFEFEIMRFRPSPNLKIFFLARRCEPISLKSFFFRELFNRRKVPAQ